MATFTREQIVGGLTRLGQLAQGQGRTVELLLLGGGVMVLVFGTRQSTRDLDVAVVEPRNAAEVRGLAKIVAEERGWPENWLSDAAKGYVVGHSDEATIFTAPGIKVRRPAFEQLLAMKLCAWRDDVDIADARRLLQEVAGRRDEVWQRVVPYLQPGRELKAKYAFDDLWEDLHGPD